MTGRCVLVALLMAAPACDDDKKSSAGPAMMPEAGAVSVASTPPSASAKPPPPAPLTPETFCDRVFGTIFRDVTKSCTDDDRKSEPFTLYFRFAKFPLDECESLVIKGVAEGHVKFDPDAAAKCAASASTSRTEESGGHVAVPDIDELPDCQTFLTGLEDEGQACHSIVDCKAGLTCVGVGSKAGGTCKKPPTKAGEACDSVLLQAFDIGHRPRCGTGLVCDTISDKCVAAIAAGGACAASAQCAPGLRCQLGKCSTDPPAELDGACRADSEDCKVGLYCAVAAGKKTGKCSERKAAGSYCYYDDECKGDCVLPEGKHVGKCFSICGSG